MAQNDTHVALIILTTQMWGGELLVEKKFSGCSCTCANIRSYTNQRARHGTPFLQPPPPLLQWASMSPPPPPPPQSNFQVALIWSLRLLRLGQGRSLYRGGGGVRSPHGKGGGGGGGVGFAVPLPMSQTEPIHGPPQQTEAEVMKCLCLDGWPALHASTTNLNHNHSARCSAPPPPPRRTIIKSSENTVRTGVSVGHAFRCIINLVLVQFSVRWTRHSLDTGGRGYVLGRRLQHRSSPFVT